VGSLGTPTTTLHLTAPSKGKEPVQQQAKEEGGQRRTRPRQEEGKAWEMEADVR